MIRPVTAALLSFYGAAALAATKAAPKAEEPIAAADNSGIILFGVIVLVLIVAFLGMMWVNSRKKPEEREGDKF